MDWSFLVIHHTASNDTPDDELSDIETYHEEERDFSDVGYHKIVELSDDQYVAKNGRPLNKAGAHTKGYNHKAIGVAHVGNFENDEPEFMMLDTSSRCVANLVMQHQIKTENIKQHKDLDTTKCPGSKFPFTDYINMVRGWVIKDTLHDDDWDIEEYQRSLNLLGFDAGPIDGIMGSMTQNGIREANEKYYSKSDDTWSDKLEDRIRHELQLTLYS